MLRLNIVLAMACGALMYGSSALADVTATGSIYTDVNGYLYVGHTADGTLAVDAGSSYSIPGAILANKSGVTGTAMVTGTGSAWTTTDQLIIGSYGSGTLTIQSGGNVSGNLNILGENSYSSGTAIVTDLGTLWTNSSYLSVGGGGSGSLSILHGAQVSNDFTTIADFMGGSGTIIVDGPGSTLTNTTNLFVGYSDRGTLSVQNGAQVNNESTSIGFQNKSVGTATVTGAGSTLTNTRGLTVGDVGTGTLTVQAGGHVDTTSSMYGDGILGSAAHSSGTINVIGAGSSLTFASYLRVGDSGSGTLNILAGARVSTADTAVLGHQSVAHGTVNVTGPGSQWSISSDLTVGPGTARLTVADGAAVTAQSLSLANTKSVVQLNVSGNNMIVLGDATTVGSVSNKGAINFYAPAYLPAGVYTPIAEYAGRAMTWSGKGTCNAFGGTWDTTAHTFTVTGPTALTAGSSAPVSSGTSVLVTDPIGGDQVGASFGTVTDGTTFGATCATDAEISALAATPGFSGSAVSAWDFATNFTGGQVLLSFDIDPGAQDFAVWHLSGGVWTPYAPDVLTYDSNGAVSFTVSSFSGYAVAEVPEPATLILLACGSGVLLLRRR